SCPSARSLRRAKRRTPSIKEFSKQLPRSCNNCPDESGSRSGCASGDESLGSLEIELFPQLAPKQQQVQAGLKNLRSDRQIPEVPNIKPGCTRDEHRRQCEQNEPARRAQQRRHGITQPLEHARARADNLGGHEIARQNSQLIAAE